MLHQGIVDIDAHFVSNREPLYVECGPYKPFTVSTIKAAERRGYVVEWVKSGVCYVHAPEFITPEQLEQRRQQRYAERESMIENRERLRIAKNAAPDLLGALRFILADLNSTLDPEARMIAEAALAKAEG